MLIKSRLSPDARRASANACPKTVIQAHQDYTLTIWTGRNAALHANTQDTELVVHAQLNAGIRQLYKLNDSFADSAKQYFHLPLEKILSRPPSKSTTMTSACPPGCSSCQWSWRGTAHSLHLLSIYTVLLPSPLNFTTNAWYVSCSPTTSIQVVITSQIYFRSLRNRHNSLPYAASLYHPSDTISQIRLARPGGLQH